MNPMFIVVYFLCFALMSTGCSEQAPASLHNKRSPSAESNLDKSGLEPPKNIAYSLIEWTDLLPDEDLKALENPPEYLDDIIDGSDKDQLASQLKASPPNINITDYPSAAERYQQALTSKNIRPDFNSRHIRIPGFIVPLEFDGHQTVTQFFIVPFFGACLHMPPPPPNQIIYAEYEPGIKLESLYDAYWISGRLSTSLVENEMATAAYSIAAFEVELYTEEALQQWDENIGDSYAK